MKGLWLAAATLVIVCSPGCSTRAATREECRQILDRIVELELHEMGFQDPALEARRKEEVERRHEADLDACLGKPISRTALECVRSAQTAEEVSHRCL